MNLSLELNEIIFYLGLNFFETKAEVQALMQLLRWGHGPRKPEWGSRRGEMEGKANTSTCHQGSYDGLLGLSSSWTPQKPRQPLSAVHI